MKKVTLSDYFASWGVSAGKIEKTAEQIAYRVLEWDKDAFKAVYTEYYQDGPGCN